MNLLNISVHFICGLCDSVVQFTGLRIIASGRKKEHIVSWRNKEDRLTMEENLQPPILYIGRFNSAFSQAPGKFFKKFFQWLNLISFLSVGTTTKKRRFYHRISASITILVFLRGKGIRCPSSLCFRMDRTMTHTFGLCESLFLVEISGIEPLTS